MVRLVVLIWVLAMVAGNSDDWAHCPDDCKCVWSGGKKAAECANSGLTAIPDRLSKEIQLLNLNGNNLYSLTPKAFSNVRLVNLHKIYIRNASVVLVDKDALLEMKVLIEIDLSENRIEHLHKDLFRDCEKIREIIFQKNPIQRLEKGLFANMKFLQKVDFSDCKLYRINIGTFSNVPALGHLEFSGNNLTTLDLEAVSVPPKLKYLGLSNNPWKCDCKLRPLRNWLLQNKLSSVNIFCPNTKKWGDLNEFEFACKPEVVDAKRDGAFLSCLVSGDPLPSVQWMFNGKPVNNHSYTGAEYLLREGSGWYNLTVRHARSRDNGVYKCIARSAGGEDARTLDVSFNEDDEFEGSFGVVSGGNSFDVWMLIVGVVLGAVILLGVVFIMCCCFCKNQRRIANKKDSSGQGDIEEKTPMNSVNLVQKPPRRQEHFNSSETELLDTTSLPYNENGSILGSSHVDSQSTPAGTLSRTRGRDSADPPDLLAFSGQSSSGKNLGSPLGVSHFGTLPYSRSRSPFSPPMPVVPRAGYVTIPRRPRSSWTASLSPVLVSPEEGLCEPVYDNLGPRTTINGSSVLSLNKIDATPPSFKNRPLPLAPYESINELERLNWSRSTPDGGDEREMLISSSPLASIAPTKKTPPNPPPKPKKKKSLYEDEGEDGTEV